MARSVALGDKYDTSSALFDFIFFFPSHFSLSYLFSSSLNSHTSNTELVNQSEGNQTEGNLKYFRCTPLSITVGVSS